MQSQKVRSGLTAAFLLCVLCVFAVNSSAHAADRWALVIGVNGFEGEGKLTVCGADARAMKTALERVGYNHVRLLVDDQPGAPLKEQPTDGNIRRSTEDFVRAAEKGDTLLFFFSGHGVMRDGESYLIPADGDRRRGVALSWVTEQLAASKATSKVLILDACHSGGAKGMGGIAPDLKVAGNLVMLLSCEKDQVSWPDDERGYSVFTAFLLDGLNGRAAGPDRKVTVGRLYGYVRGQVKGWTIDHQKDLQTPVINPDAPQDQVLAECPEGEVAVEPPPRPPTPAPQPPRPTEPARSLSLDCGNGVEMKLALIPAGEFMMGGEESPEQVARKCGGIDAKAEWFQAEQPRHRVKITKPFYMGVYEVTQAQYEAVTGANPSNFKGANNPVETVSWNEAAEFCRKLSEKTGQTVRLPTEAEWEYACRAGTTTPFSFGETISTDQANYDGNYTYGNGRKGEYRQKTMEAGSFPANAFGLYDMRGNVWEWCQDWYGSYPGGAVVDPQGPANGESRVLRGGSWVIYPWFCRSAIRVRVDPTDRLNGYGFRVVCAPRP